MPFVEFGLGAWYVKGGMYEIPKALEKLAKEFGVKIYTESEVEKIEIKNGKAVGVRVGGEVFGCDFVVANSDAVETYRNLIDKKARKSFSDKKIEKHRTVVQRFCFAFGNK